MKNKKSRFAKPVYETIFELHIHNLFFTVKLINPKYRYMLDVYVKRFITYKFEYNYKFKKMVRKYDKSFFSYVKDKDEYHFHINSIKDFLSSLALSGIRKENIKMVLHRLKETDCDKLNAKMLDSFTLRDYQKDYINALNINKPYMLIDLFTGGGKSIIFTKAMLNINYKTAMVLLPRYIDKWLEDITTYTNIKPEEICVVRGQESLDKLWNTKKKDIKYKIFLFSITTLSNFISAYEENSNDCSYSLGELSKHLGIGLLANDESHQHFNALFKISIHFEALRMLGMTATMVNNAADITRMYTLFYPYDSRVANLVKRDGYIDVYPIMYVLRIKKSFKFMLNGGYNHNQFEQSMLRYPMLTKTYLQMIEYYLKEGFINHRTHKEKCIIFFSSIKLCTLATNYFKTKFKDLDIRRYVEQDGYENISEGDIIISTQQSLGTAFTVPNLITILNTVPMSSIQANKQNIGRLRQIEGKELRYYYFYTNTIPAHRKMSVDRLEAIKDITKSTTYKSYDETLIV
ncbi:DEAD/DEAH box helicase family protein [Campylobacter coli]